MAILTKPTIAKGQPNEIDLSKSELAAISKVVNDSYFSDQTNWSKVIVEYKSAEGNQHEMMIFDATGDSPKGNFEVSEKAKDSWEVQSVKIIDFDGGYLKLVRGDLTVENFDIALGSVGGDIGGLVSSPFLTNLPYPFNKAGAGYTNNDYTVESTGEDVNFRTDLKTIAPQGKYYVELNLDQKSTEFYGYDFLLGIFETNYVETGLTPTGGASVYAAIVRSLSNGSFDFENSIGNSGLTKANSSLNNGDVIGMAIDIELGVSYFHINGSWFNGADPSNNTGGYSDIYTANISSSVGKLIVVSGRIWGGGKVTTVENPQFIPDGYEPV